MEAPLLVTIDGPAGCGKSTVTRELARSLGGVAFGTGAIYRGVTFAALEAGVNLEEPDQVLALLRDHPLSLTVVEPADAAGVAELQVSGDGWSPSAELHTPRVTREIHWVADDPGIRAALLELQRQIPRDGVLGDRAVVAEGRDLGTVVFADAPVKVFLTASVEERARRRLRDWETSGGAGDHDLASVMAEIEARDRNDREREVAPLVPAPDARVVDCTTMAVAEVVVEIRKGIPARWLETPPPGGSIS